MIPKHNELPNRSIGKTSTAMRAMEKDLGRTYCTNILLGRLFFALFALGNLLYPRNLSMVTICNELPNSSVAKTLTAKRVVDLGRAYYTDKLIHTTF